MSILSHNGKSGPLRTSSSTLPLDPPGHRGYGDFLIMGFCISLPILILALGTIFHDRKEHAVHPGSLLILPFYEVSITGVPGTAFEGTVTSRDSRNGETIQKVEGVTPAVYQVTAEEIECAISKKNGGDHELSVQILKDGKMIATSSSSEAFDKISLRDK